MASQRPQSILITGASSGIGAALAAAYATNGVTLHLGGRDHARLEAVAGLCRDQGAEVVTRRQDVADAAGMARWVEAAFSVGPIDLVIANAGIAAETAPDTRGEGGRISPIPKILTTNVVGVINTIYPALEHMLARPHPVGGTRGQIAIMSSIAGFRGMPTAPAYCASKAALRALGENLRPALTSEGIRVSVISPGFVRSPMTETNDFPMPFLMTAEGAAEIIQHGLAMKRDRITFPRRLAAAAWVLASLPAAWTERILVRTHRPSG